MRLSLLMNLLPTLKTDLIYQKIRKADKDSHNTVKSEYRKGTLIKRSKLGKLLRRIKQGAPEIYLIVRTFQRQGDKNGYM